MHVYIEKKSTRRYPISRPLCMQLVKPRFKNYSSETAASLFIIPKYFLSNDAPIRFIYRR